MGKYISLAHYSNKCHTFRHYMEEQEKKKKKHDKTTV